MKKSTMLKNNLLCGICFILMMISLFLIFLHVPAEKEMGDIQRIFYFHVPLAWIAFLAFFVVFITGILYLWKRHQKWDIMAQASAQIGIIFTTLVLITGPIWAKPVWGSWWTWDARLTATLILWLTYIAYLLVRSYAGEEERGARFASVIGIMGFINVPIVYLSVNLWRTQHPEELVSDLDGSMLLTLLISIATFTALYVLLMALSCSIKELQNRVRLLKQLSLENER